MNAKRTIATLIVSAVTVLGPATAAGAKVSGTAASRTPSSLAKDCKAAGGTSFVGSKGSGRYGCIKDNGAAGSDAYTCTNGKCVHEHFNPIT